MTACILCQLATMQGQWTIPVCGEHAAALNEQNRDDERARIVCWMRKQIAKAYELDGHGTLSPQWFVEAIDRGEYRR